MTGSSAGFLAVQISSVHHARPGQGGAWEMVLLFGGMLLVVRGVVVWVRHREWRAGARPTQGCVIDHVARGRGWIDHGRLAIIEYDVEGTTFVLPGWQAPRSRGFPVGRAVDVLYDVGEPRRAGLAETRPPMPWTMVLGLVLLGSFLAVVVV